MKSKNSWNKEYETKVDKNGKKHTRMVKHGMKPSKKSLAFSKHVNKMKTSVLASASSSTSILVIPSRRFWIWSTETLV